MQASDRKRPSGSVGRWERLAVWLKRNGGSERCDQAQAAGLADRQMVGSSLSRALVKSCGAAEASPSNERQTMRLVLPTRFPRNPM